MGRPIGASRQLGHVVLRDQAAHRDAREIVEQREHRVPHRAAHVLEIDVDAARAGCSQLLGEILRAVVDRRVEAQRVDEIAALVAAAGDAHGARALDFRDLPDHRADRPGGGGDRDGLAGLRLADGRKARVGGHARHAEHAERRRYRRAARIELAQARAVRHRVILPAAIAEHDVARLESGMPRIRHLVDRAADHRLTDLDGLRVGPRRAHAPAHVGIEREPQRAQQHLALARLRRRALFEAEIARLRRALGP